MIFLVVTDRFISDFLLLAHLGAKNVLTFGVKGPSWHRLAELNAVHHLSK